MDFAHFANGDSITSELVLVNAGTAANGSSCNTCGRCLCQGRLGDRDGAEVASRAGGQARLRVLDADGEAVQVF